MPLATLKPLTDDDAVYGPLPRRLGHRDPYLEPVGQPFRGVLLGALLGGLGWLVIFLIIFFLEAV